MYIRGAIPDAFSICPKLLGLLDAPEAEGLACFSACGTPCRTTSPAPRSPVRMVAGSCMMGHKQKQPVIKIFSSIDYQMRLSSVRRSQACTNTLSSNSSCPRLGPAFNCIPIVLDSWAGGAGSPYSRVRVLNHRRVFGELMGSFCPLRLKSAIRK